tara:strand:- start:330 stop:737 length:408 start_codon:yes stop_codon:yes gene_type:complete
MESPQITSNILSPTNINNIELTDFKLLVKQWLLLDNQISEREKDIRDLKKRRTKEIEPKIVEFMKNHNITDLNTDNGKLKCVEKITKQGFNKKNIRENLSCIIDDNSIIDEAMDKIINNRTSKTSHKLTKMKKLK